MSADQSKTVATQPEDPKSVIVDGVRGIDTRPKHLLHRKAEDLVAPDNALIELEMKELIEEARAKIKPVI